MTTARRSRRDATASRGWLLRARELTARRGAAALFEGLSLSVDPGRTLAVVGRNGSGKSTLLLLLAGRREPDGGWVDLRPGTTQALLEQDPVIDPGLTVEAAARSGLGRVGTTLARYDRLAERLAVTPADSALLAELGATQDELTRLDGWTIDARVREVLQALGCPPADRTVGSLSEGERRRVALCRLLVEEPELMLLDEPTNFLDAEACNWLDSYLAGTTNAVVIATHDRRLLHDCADSVLELERGHACLTDGGYLGYLRAVASGPVNGRADARRVGLARAELAALSSARTATGPAGREGAPQPAARAIIDARAAMPVPRAPRLGRDVVEVRGLSLRLGDRLVIDDLSFDLPRGGVVGVIGPNGVGKTTLLRLLAGVLRPDRGEVRVGESVQIAYVDRADEPRDAALSLWEAVSQGRASVQVGAGELPVRAYLAAFGFRGADQLQPVGRLSGGERNRLRLALTLLQGGNLLLLDEPTNDLDLWTIAALENALQEFSGTTVVATHDRALLERLSTAVLAWSGSPHDTGRWTWGDAGMVRWVEGRGGTAGPGPSAPDRIEIGGRR